MRLEVEELQNEINSLQEQVFAYFIFVLHMCASSNPPIQSHSKHIIDSNVREVRAIQVALYFAVKHTHDRSFFYTSG